jgi:mannose-6-phosphate isomerase class I
VDEKAWTDGVGAIRYGFSAEKRAQFSSDAEFLAGYRIAIRQYHAVRREIDVLLDACRQRDNIGLNEPVSAVQTQQWLTAVPPDMQQRERKLRHAMEAFTALRELRVGDVLAVPLRTPHALQHGVRTVEFQTPVYERKILSFAQKVLTQEHWDTDEALQVVSLTASADEIFPVICDDDGVKIEQIVQFDDFTVQRIYLQPGADWPVNVDKDYALLMSVTGQVLCAGLEIGNEQAVLIPASAAVVIVTNRGGSTVEMLLARPV